MKTERIFKEELIEKRPPLYIYKAKIGDTKIYLNELIPYFATQEEAVAGFIETVDELSDAKPKYIVNISRTKKKGTRIVSVEMFYTGLNLEEFIRNKGTLNVIDSISLIATICKAFQEFHSRRVFGVGIEQKNIIVKNPQNLKIIHPLLAIAEKYLRKSKKPEMLNPLYLAPEQIEKDLKDERSDLFNIGILFFLILYNTYPFKDKSYTLAKRDITYPYCLTYITERLLQREPSKRFSSIENFLEELSLCREEIQTQNAGLTKPEKSKIVQIESNSKWKKKTKQPEPKKEEQEKRKKQKTLETTGREKPVLEKKLPKKRLKIEKQTRIPFKKNTLLIGASIVFLFVICVIFVPKFIRIINPYRITHLSIANNIATTLDDKQKILWKFKTGSDISFSEIIDFDNDGRNEIILGTGFLLTNQKGENSRGKDNAGFYILNENGKCLYSKQIGSASIYAEGSSLWSIYDIKIFASNDKGINSFAALAISEDSLDCILFVKNERGKTSRFWHTGKITEVIPFETSGGEKILICAGENKRMGSKPVVFALKQESFNDQSPPWRGELEKNIKGLKWYRFEPGSGPVKRITKKDTTSIIVEGNNGITKFYETETGYEINEEDTSAEMHKERGRRYSEAFESLMKAEKYSKDSKLDLALSTYDESIHNQIEDRGFTSVLFYEKGMLFFDQQKWKLSSIALANAVKADPLFYEAFYRLGLAYSEREQFKNAAQTYRKVFNLSGKEEQFYKIVDSYSALGNYKTSNALLKGFKREARNTSLFLLQTSKVNREQGNFRIAASALETLISQEPKNVEAKVMLADIYADMGENTSTADSLFKYSCKKDSSFYYENIETVAWISYRKSNFDDAFQELSTAIDREEEKAKTSVSSRRKLPRLYYRTAIVAQTLGKKKIKEESIKKAKASKFCKGYIRKQLNYLIGSSE